MTRDRSQTLPVDVLQAGIGVSTEGDPRRAAAQAARAARDAAGGAVGAALVFASPDHAELGPEVLEEVAEALGSETLAGASVQGLLARDLEAEGGPVLGVVALGGIDARPFLVDGSALEDGRGPDEIARRAQAREGDLVLLFADPDAMADGSLLPSLAEALAPAALVGAGAVDAGGGAALQWAGLSTATGAVSGMRLRGAAPPRIGVTQSCLPATCVMSVTRANGHWVQELDGRPALDVFREVARGPLAADLRRAAAFVMAALPASPADDALEAGRYRVRNVVGFDPESGAIALAQRLGPGDRMGLAVREPEAARADLKRMLARMADPAPRLALYFDCVARGAALFGIEGLEGGYLCSALGSSPVLGVLGSFEIGPVAGPAEPPELLTYTGVLAALDG
jgi:small ligand-binding sensory domain FIST